MDTAPLLSIIREQLSTLRGLESLQLQNHIYGCFIIMEDIAQKTLKISKNHLVGSNVILDLDQDFSKIGLQFGFVMNSKLGLSTVPLGYQEAWCQIFHALETVEQVDPIEDAMIDVIQQTVHEDDAYFMHALDTGSLPQEWLTKIIELLHPTEPAVIESPVSDSLIHRANTEKNPKKPRWAMTRRRRSAANSHPRSLATTRRRK